MNTETITTIEVDTKAHKDADSVKTNLSIDWSDMTAEDIRALAQQALIVKLQSGWRKNGIPSGDATVNASEYKIGVRAKRTPVTLESLLAALSPEEKAELLAKHIG